MSNKKSQLEDWFPTILLVGILAILFIFLSSSAASNEKKKIQLEFQSFDIDSGQFLLDYLRTPFDDANNGNVADGIRSYFITQDEDLLKQIDAKAQEFFSTTDLEASGSSWSLEIQHSSKKNIIIEPKKVKALQNPDVPYLKKEVSKIFIPGYNGDLIEITLFYFTIKG